MRALHTHCDGSTSDADTARPVDPWDQLLQGVAPHEGPWTVTVHFGCYYCNELEGNESSIPQLAALTCRGNPAALHAGDEVLLCYGAAPLKKDCAVEGEASMPGSGVYVIGKGNIGLNSDESIESRWQRMPIASPAVQQVSGRSHFLIWIDGDVGGCVLMGFGDNLHGQLALGRESEREIAVQPVLSINQCIPVAYQARGAKTVLDRQRIDEVLDSEGKGFLLQRLRDVQCGVRHSVVLFDGKSM
jgi:hypothetical protein